MLPGAEWVIFLHLNKNFEISPNYGGIIGLIDLRENSKNIHVNQEYVKNVDQKYV